MADAPKGPGAGVPVDPLTLDERHAVSRQRFIDGGAAFDEAPTVVERPALRELQAEAELQRTRVTLAEHVNENLDLHRQVAELEVRLKELRCWGCNCKLTPGAEERMRAERIVLDAARDWAALFNPLGPDVDSAHRALYDAIRALAKVPT